MWWRPYQAGVWWGPYRAGWRTMHPCPSPGHAEPPGKGDGPQHSQGQYHPFQGQKAAIPHRGDDPARRGPAAWCTGHAGHTARRGPAAWCRASCSGKGRTVAVGRAKRKGVGTARGRVRVKVMARSRVSVVATARVALPAGQWP